MSGITLHPRTMEVAKAQTRATLWLIGWQEENDLTEGEVLGWLAQQLAQMAKYAVRNERCVEKGDESGPDEPTRDWPIVPAAPSEDWPSPLVVASGENTPEGAAEKLGWPLVVCEAIHAQFLASALDPYEGRYLKAVRAGQERLESFRIGQFPGGPRDRTRQALEELASSFVDKLEGGGE